MERLCRGRTPLHVAATHGRLAVSEQLLDRGAAVDVPDKHGRMPLHYAAEHGAVAVAKLLLGRGASVAAADVNGW